MEAFHDVEPAGPTGLGTEAGEGKLFDIVLQHFAHAEDGLGDDIKHTAIIHPGVSGITFVHQDERGDVVDVAPALEVDGLVGV